MEDVRPVDEEAIRRRAYEISQRADGGSPEENWRRAREELLDELDEQTNVQSAPDDD